MGSVGGVHGQSKGNDSGRENWIDNARIFAIFAIIGVHSATSVALAPLGTSQWWYADMYASALRWAAPLFIMISGYNLLHSDGSVRPLEFYKKRLPKVVVPLLFWHCIYHANHLIGLIRRHEAIDAFTEINDFVTGSPYIAIWFIYAIVGLYLLAPLFQIIIASVERSYLFALCGILFFVSTAQWAFDSFDGKTENALLLTSFIRFIPYFLMGGAMRSYSCSGRPLWFSSAMIILALSILTFLVARNVGITKALLLSDYNSPLVTALSICIFISLRSINVRVFGKISNFLSKNTMGVYLIHMWPMKLMDHVVHYPENSPLVVVPVMMIGSGVLSFLIVYALRDIKYIRAVI